LCILSIFLEPKDISSQSDRQIINHDPVSLLWYPGKVKLII